MKMPDREKVVKGLECCASMNGSACRECPYSSECVASEATYQTGTAHLAADALALLKEQEAVPVIQREIMHMLFWCCSSCGVAITDGDKFCRNCGKGLIWK